MSHHEGINSMKQLTSNTVNNDSNKSTYLLLLGALQAACQLHGDAQETLLTMLTTSELPKYLLKSDVLLMVAWLFELSCVHNNATMFAEIGQRMHIFHI